MSDDIDWRDGDVVIAFPYGEARQYSQIPRFSSAPQVRHAALWAHDFEVADTTPVVLWMPGIWPVRTEMPGPARWQSDIQTFAGHFSRRFPGRWVPVPWIHSDEVHLCLQDTEENICNVLFEWYNGQTLLGACRRVYRWASFTTLAEQFGTNGAPLLLLGAPFGKSTGPLRDGDILYYETSRAKPQGPLSSLWFGLQALHAVYGLLSHRSHRYVDPLFALGALHLFTCVAAAPTQDPGHYATWHAWIWSPFGGKIGPVEAADTAAIAHLHHLEPWWARGIVPVAPRIDPLETHWLPRSPSEQFAVVLVNRAPSPHAMLLPCRLFKSALKSILGHYSQGTFWLCGRIPQLSEHVKPEVDVHLRDGDVLSLVPHGWEPSIARQPRHHFPNVELARALGCWSHSLSFEGDCWILLWRPQSRNPEAVFAQGRQTWDPLARTLRPALRHLPDSWWPSYAGVDTRHEPLHLVAADADDSSAVTVLQPQPWHCLQLTDPERSLRTGDVLGTDSTNPHIPSNGQIFSAEQPQTSPHRADSSRRTPSVPVTILVLSFGAGRHTGWQLSILACYLAAMGSPHIITRDMEPIVALTARLHARWWHRPLPQAVPPTLPAGLRAAWHAFPPVARVGPR